MKEIEKALQELEKLLRKWGIDSKDWILVANYAYKLLTFDVNLRPGHLNILIPKGKIPWKIKEGVEIHPPRNSKYRDDFKNFIDKTGFDFDINLTSLGEFKKKEGKYVKLTLGNRKKIKVQTPEGAFEEFEKLLSLSTREGLGIERVEKDIKNIKNLISALSKKGEKDTVERLGKLLKRYKKAEKKRVKEKISKKIIYGIPASGGRVKGKVKVVEEAHEAKSLKKGDILVTKMTSPTLVVTLPKISAIITDWGGKLSHAAILAREIGVPAVVGTQIATKILKTGDLVEVDADTGFIMRLGNEKSDRLR